MRLLVSGYLVMKLLEEKAMILLELFPDQMSYWLTGMGTPKMSLKNKISKSWKMACFL